MKKHAFMAHEIDIEDNSILYIVDSEGNIMFQKINDVLNAIKDMSKVYAIDLSQVTIQRIEYDVTDTFKIENHLEAVAINAENR